VTKERADQINGDEKLLN